MAETSHVLEDMVAASERTAASVIALKEFRVPEISAYGCVAIDPVADARRARSDPRPRREARRAEDAPVEPGDHGSLRAHARDLRLHRTGGSPVDGGEIQLTDAMSLLLEQRAALGPAGSPTAATDTGNKLDWLRATVELALEREDLGPGSASTSASSRSGEGLL